MTNMEPSSWSARHKVGQMSPHILLMLLRTLWAVGGGQGSLWGARGADGRSRPRLKGGRPYIGLGE